MTALSLDVREISVGEVMLRDPKRLPADASVADARAVLSDSHVHMVLLTEGDSLVGTLLRSDLPDGGNNGPALRWSELSGRTAPPSMSAQTARDRMITEGIRRIAVVSDDGMLLGLLCLKRNRTGFCTTTDVASRAADLRVPLHMRGESTHEHLAREVGTTPSWDAVILAGGRGSRLGGVDKSAIEFGGESLMERTLRVVKDADRIVVVGRVEAPGALVVCESPPGGGPAAALGAALDHVSADFVLLVGCDQPFLSDALNILLASAYGDGAVAIDGSGRRQHLMSILQAEALRSVVAAQGHLQGLALRTLLDSLELQEVSVPSRSTLDIDTSDDEARARTLESCG